MLQLATQLVLEQVLAPLSVCTSCLWSSQSTTVDPTEVLHVVKWKTVDHLQNLKNPFKLKKKICDVPFEVRAACETDIPRHDLTG